MCRTKIKSPMEIKSNRQKCANVFLQWSYQSNNKTRTVCEAKNLNTWFLSASHYHQFHTSTGYSFKLSLVFLSEINSLSVTLLAKHCKYYFGNFEEKIWQFKLFGLTFLNVSFSSFITIFSEFITLMTGPESLSYN